MNDLLGVVRGEPVVSVVTSAWNTNGSSATPQHNPFFTREDVEAASPPAPTTQDPEMQQFFRAVEDIKLDMAEIKETQREILSMHEAGKTIVKSQEMHRHREEMQERMNHVNAIAHKVKAKVDALDQQNVQSMQLPGQGPGSARERTRTNITAGLKRKLKDLMGDFTDMRTMIHNEYREVIERRVYTVTGQRLQEEDIDRMIENGEAENIFQTAIMEQGRGRVLDTLAEIQERHQAVKDLEQSLMELHQIFLDMAVLVDAQGETLDNIERQVERSVDYVKHGTIALQDAKKYQKNKRKWITLGVIVLIIIIAIIVIFSVRPWQYVHTG